jgi:hypothetical protein
MIRRRRPDPSVWSARLRCVAVLLAAALALRAGVALAAPSGVAPAAPSGVALIIGEGRYADQSPLAACSRAAASVVARVQRLGFTVDQAIDAPAGVVRGALESFASHVQAAAPAGPVLVYVCAEAAVVGPRLFLLPSEIDLHQTLRPETQGIVVRTLLRILAGTKGSLVMELSVPAGTVAAQAARTLAARTLAGELPDGLHLAMTIGDGKQAGAFGRLLASDADDPTQDWGSLAAALRNSLADTAPAITIYAPEPAPATVASSEPGAATPPASDPASPTPPPSAPVPPSSAPVPPAPTGPAADANPVSSDVATSRDGAGPSPSVAMAPQETGTPGSATPPPTTPAPATSAPTGPASPAPASTAPMPATSAPTASATSAPTAPASATPEPTTPATPATPAATTPATSTPGAPAPSRAAPTTIRRANTPSSDHDLNAGAASTRRAPAPAAAADNRAASPARIAPDSPRSSRTPAPEREAPPLEAQPDGRILRLQAALARRGLYPGPLDGLASLRTVQAIRGYQASLRDPPTGVLTQIEIVRLLNNW